MSSATIPPRSGETHAPIIALFPGDDVALAAIERLGLRLLRFAGPGVAVLDYQAGCTGKLYQAGATLVID
ncbi:hypothetical protein IAI18_05910 [Acetobacteraceae bacterium H6797]|nr:hypothetical protein [Acetobacteraceae bacterium H6797]